MKKLLVVALVVVNTNQMCALTQRQTSQRQSNKQHENATQQRLAAQSGAETLARIGEDAE